MTTTVHPDVLTVLEALVAEIQALQTAHTVQKSAYLAMALHLAKQGHVQLPVLAADLEILAAAQADPADPGWQAGHAELACGLMQLHAGCRMPAGGQ